MINAKEFLKAINAHGLDLYEDYFSRIMEDYAREFFKDAPVHVLQGVENIEVSKQLGVIVIKQLYDNASVRSKPEGAAPTTSEIEELGWKHEYPVPFSNMLRFSMGEYLMSFDTAGEFITTISKRQNEDDYTLFRGRIKNKNELKKLMEQIIL